MELYVNKKSAHYTSIKASKAKSVVEFFQKVQALYDFKKNDKTKNQTHGLVFCFMSFAHKIAVIFLL